MTDQRNFNTSIQGQSLIAATNGLDVRALNFTNFLQQLPPITGTVATTANDIDASRLYVSDLIQSSVGHFLVNATGSSDPELNYCDIYLGPDTPEQASGYISLFNLKSNADVRILDFLKVNNIASDVYLANSPPYTANYVTVNNVAGSRLFGKTAKAGTHRLVSVQKTSSDNTKVNFTVLPGCCDDLNEGNPIWATRIDGANIEYTNSFSDYENYRQTMTEDKDGNIYEVFYSTSNPVLIYNSDGSYESAPNPNPNNYNIFLAKYDKFGMLLWYTKVLGTQLFPNCISTDSEGNVYLQVYPGAATFKVYNSDNTEFETIVSTVNSFYIIKFNQNGYGLWKIYLENITGDFICMLNDSDNNLYLNLKSRNFLVQVIDVYDKDDQKVDSIPGTYQPTIKFDKNGYFLWSSTNSGGGSRNYSLINGNNLFILADAITTPATFYNPDGSPFYTDNSTSKCSYLIKCDTNGGIISLHKFSIYTTGSVNFYQIEIDSDGKIILIGFMTNSACTLYDINGNLAKTIPTPPTPPPSYGYVIAKIDEQGGGNVSWGTYTSIFDNNQNITFTIDSANNIYLYFSNSGQTDIRDKDEQIVKSFNNSGSCCYIVKYSSVGNVLWSTYIGPSDTNTLVNSLQILLDENDNLILNGNYSNTTVTLFNPNGSPFSTLPTADSTAVFIFKYKQP